MKKIVIEPIAGCKEHEMNQFILGISKWFSVSKSWTFEEKNGVIVDYFKTLPRCIYNPEEVKDQMVQYLAPLTINISDTWGDIPSKIEIK